MIGKTPPHYRMVEKLGERSGMKPDRWHKVEEIYHAALERAPGQRASFLEN